MAGTALEPSRGGFGLWHCDPVPLSWDSELPMSCFLWEEVSGFPGFPSNFLLNKSTCGT